jgi:hypothetical protein
MLGAIKHAYFRPAAGGGLAMVCAGEALHRLQDQNSIHADGQRKRLGCHEHAGFMVGVLFCFFSANLLKK